MEGLPRGGAALEQQLAATNPEPLAILTYSLRDFASIPFCKALSGDETHTEDGDGVEPVLVQNTQYPAVKK